MTASVPVCVDYEVTELGRSLLTPIMHVKAWAGRHMPEVDNARGAYDARQA